MVTVVLMVCIGFAGTISFAQSEKKQNERMIPIQSLEKVNFNGPLSNINYVNRSMVVKTVDNQFNVHVASNLLLSNGEPLTTSFIDENGKTIPFSEFMNNQWVKVTGYKTNEGAVFAAIIQRQFNQSVKNTIPIKTVYKNYSV